MKSNGWYVGSWLAAVGLAVALAFVAPNESSVMGRLPAFMAQSRLRQSMSMPKGLPAERTLALITFKHSQQAEAESWIQGLNLRNDTSIAWMRMPVLNDPGTDAGRSVLESKLLRHYPDVAEHARLVPVFTDRTTFARSAGLPGTNQVYALVLNRQGDVLARVEGPFDPDKARALRETLLRAGDL